MISTTLPAAAGGSVARGVALSPVPASKSCCGVKRAERAWLHAISGHGKMCRSNQLREECPTAAALYRTAAGQRKKMGGAVEASCARGRRCGSVEREGSGNGNGHLEQRGAARGIQRQGCFHRSQKRNKPGYQVMISHFNVGPPPPRPVLFHSRFYPRLSHRPRCVAGKLSNTFPPARPPFQKGSAVQVTSPCSLFTLFPCRTARHLLDPAQPKRLPS